MTYTVHVVTHTETIDRVYESMEDLSTMVEAIKSGMNTNFVFAGDNPITLLNSKNIIKVVISGASSAEIAKYLDEKWERLAKEKQAALDSKNKGAA